jgi:Sec-independent protein translocase protein TatA
MEVGVVAFMVGRELAILLVIALLAAGGSQLPKLVRAFGEGTKPKLPATDEETGPDTETNGRGH